MIAEIKRIIKDSEIMKYVGSSLCDTALAHSEQGRRYQVASEE